MSHSILTLPSSLSRVIGLALLITTAAGLSACGHVTLKDTDLSFQSVCSPTPHVSDVKGSVWMKARSKEATGQFPALVHAVDQGRLELQITNLLGASEAVVKVDEKTFTIESHNPKISSQKGSGVWAGIPLKWATVLFLGQMPCPDAAAQKSMMLSKGEKEGELRVRIPAAAGQSGDEESYVYSFKSWAGQPWVDHLFWERKGSRPLTIEIQFDDPDPAQNLPRRWEAKSSLGEVKVRWKDRELSR